MSRNKYFVQVDIAADEKMYNHIRFLARVSVMAAERLFVALKKAIDSLEDSPKSCPLYISQRPIDAELRYKLCGKRYKIVFEVIGNDVFVYDTPAV